MRTENPFLICYMLRYERQRCVTFFETYLYSEYILKELNATNLYKGDAVHARIIGAN